MKHCTLLTLRNFIFEHLVIFFGIILYIIYNRHISVYIAFYFLLCLTLNKKDGYRQQNVHQRQKLISIIDYDVGMTFY